MRHKLGVYFSFSLILIFLGVSTNLSAQVSAKPTDLVNSFTYPNKVPYGCLFIIPSVAGFVPAPQNISFDQTVTVLDNGLSATFRLRVWRIGCYEPNRSAIALNVDFISGSPLVRYPLVKIADTDTGNTYNAGLFLSNRPHDYYRKGWSVNSASPSAFGFPEDAIFIVEAPNIETSLYNLGNLALAINWENGEELLAPVFPYDPTFDLAQAPSPPIHGRYSGQWTSPNLPRSGLVLQIGEISPDRNFVFAIWFTYLDGAPIWVVGNADLSIGSNEVEIPMSILDGGGFVTNPGSFVPGDVAVTSVGMMTIRAIHCNVIEADMEFSEAGLGQQTLELNRLIRIAGFDCDQTQ